MLIYKERSRSKSNLRSENSTKRTSLFKMHLGLEIDQHIERNVLSIICFISFSNCQVEQMKTVFFQLFSHVRCACVLDACFKYRVGRKTNTHTV